MIKNVLTLILVLLTGLTTFGQQGDLYLTHHGLEVDGFDNVNFQMKFNSNGQLCIANKSGLLFYDGRQWDYVSTPSAAISVDFDKNDQLYVGLVDDYGKIDLHDGEYKFVSLDANNHDLSIYFKTVCTDSSVYFLSEQNLLRYNPDQNRTYITYLEDKEDYFDNLFIVDSTLQVQTSDSLYEYAGDQLLESHLVKPDSGSFIFFNKHPKLERYVVGTTDNKGYIYRKNKFFECKVSKFLTENESFLVDGKWLNKRHFALSTLENGVILYDNHKSRIREVINQTKGLPDNQVQAIGVDKEEGLWISHEFGLSRMEMGIPFRSFSNFRGLHGKIFEVFFFKRNLYVATSEGVYYLDKEEHYKNKVYYVEKNKKSIASSSRKSTKRKKSRFSRKKKPEVKKTESLTFKRRKQDLSKYVRKVEKELVSTDWVFKRVQGFRSKAEEFIVFDGKLLVAGTGGVYEIKENEASMVIHEPARFVTVDTKRNQLIVGTWYDEIKIFQMRGDIWSNPESLDLRGQQVLTAFHDVSERTWFVTANALMEFKDVDPANVTYNEYEYKNHFVDESKLAYIKKQLYLINREGYFYLHTGQKKMVEDTTLANEIGLPIKHLQQRNGIIWVFNGENWYMIKRDGTPVQMDVFGLFPDMSYVSVYGNRHWIINNSQEILQHEPALDDTLVSHNKLFISRVSNNLGHVKLQNNMSFDHDESSIQFELSRPDYRGILNPEFQYRLKGMNNRWSEWSHQVFVNLPYLPPGNYEFDVRARDMFGNIEEVDPVKFHVKPPYWQTWWFSFLQILFMGGLIFASIAMNRRAKTKYVIVTEGLTILTIVMVIEFLQTVAGNTLGIQSSPVVDFGLNVIIALMVFPLEQFLKKVMRAENTKKSGLNGKGLLDLLGITKQKNTSS